MSVLLADDVHVIMMYGTVIQTKPRTHEFLQIVIRGKKSGNLVRVAILLLAQNNDRLF